MAELTTVTETSSCCAPAAQDTCCEASEKSACCGTSAAGGRCGCSAGEPAQDIRETVREKYAAAARRAAEEPTSCGCGAADDAVFGSTLYDEAETAGATAAAVDASLGCGVPTAVADLNVLHGHDLLAPVRSR